MSRAAVLVAVVLLLVAPAAVSGVGTTAGGVATVQASPNANASTDPAADFEYAPETPSPDDEITLDAGDSTDPDGEIVSYEWDTNGDGTYGDYWNDASDGETTTVSYGSGGTYTVGLKVTDDDGNADTIRKDVTVTNSEPRAWFQYSPETPVPDETITLDAGDSMDPDGEIVSYEWDTNGDGTYSDYWNDASDGETTTISYGSGGTYTVGLKITDNGGKTATATREITVENSQPKVWFDYSPETPNPDDEITLDATRSYDPDGEIVSYEWDTDGDGDYSDYWNDASDGETTTVTYGSEGTYTVRLQVTDNGGKTTTETKQIVVSNEEPTADFEYAPETPNPDDEITLDANKSIDVDGEIVAYEWDTDGDGDYGTGDDADDGESTTVTYDTGGNHTVRLRVTDVDGKTHEVERKIFVENPAPTAVFDYEPETPNPDDEIALDAGGSSDPDGEIVSYDWDIERESDGGETTIETDGETATVTYDTGGTYTVGLRVIDNGGETDVTRREIVVKNPEPSAGFEILPSIPAPGDEIILDAGDSADPDGEIVAYEWDTDGDGTYGGSGDAADGEITNVSYKTQDAYTIGLRVTDNGGATATKNRTLSVSRPPEPSIELSAHDVGRNETVTFDASGSTDPDGEIVEYNWTFDDKQVVRGTSVERSFSEFGDHVVTLTVVDDTGHEVTAEQTVTVHQLPTATIEIEPEEPVAGMPIEIEARSDDDIDAYEWDVTGDGAVDYTSSAIEHAFEEAGDRTVTLTLTSRAGVSNRESRTITVDPDPSFELTSNRDTIEAGETAVVMFSVANNIPDRPVDARLQFDLPDTGVSIASVEGASVEGASATDFVTVSGGELRSLRVRMRFNDPGAYEIGAQSTYYFDGDQSNLHRTDIEPIRMTVTGGDSNADDESNEAAPLPGFRPLVAIAAIALAAGLIATRARRAGG